MNVMNADTDTPTSVQVELDVPARMRDGVVLRADVYRPTGDGPWPILVVRTPYNKGGAADNVSTAGRSSGWMLRSQPLSCSFLRVLPVKWSHCLLK